MMLKIMAESHPKDLSVERLIQSLKISPSKIVEQVPTAIALINNVEGNVLLMKGSSWNDAKDL